MAQLKIVYWRDIPGQVVVKVGRSSRRVRLSAKFRKAIERATYRLKKKQADAWFEPWHDVRQPFSGDVNEQAELLVKQLEQEFTEEVLEKLIRSNGVAEPRNLNA